MMLVLDDVISYAIVRKRNYLQECNSVPINVKVLFVLQSMILHQFLRQKPEVSRKSCQDDPLGFLIVKHGEHYGAAIATEVHECIEF